MYDNRNKNHSARRKYLSFDHSLTSEEQSIIDKDLSSPEFSAFEADTGKDLLLPEQYSAASTYPAIDKQIRERTFNPKQKINWKIWSIAASIALLIGCSFIFFHKNHTKEQKQILVSTHVGERLEIRLPDSSLVILNAMSTLSYPEKFDKNKREVTLTGEGYFEVNHDETKPFKVKTEDIYITVLGTIFNIQAYKDENFIETALLNGSVSINIPGKEPQLLSPNEIAYYSRSNQSIKIETTDLSSITDWQNGHLIFDNCPLQEIFRTLERNDNVKLTIEDNQLKDFRMTARFMNHETTREILDILSNSAGFTYKKQDKKYIIKQTN